VAYGDGCTLVFLFRAIFLTENVSIKNVILKVGIEPSSITEINDEGRNFGYQEYLISY